MTWPRDAPGAADRYAEAFEAWLALGGADLEPRAETVLRDLGLDPALLDLETAALSGGQAARASLAAILLSRFDVLLLDEPTNDLDFDGLARLERFVAERPGGAVIVSHDRAFLEHTVTRVLELDEIAHTAAEFGGGWAGYLELRATAAPPRRGALRDLHRPARPPRRPRAQPAPVVGDGRAQGQGVKRRARQGRPPRHAPSAPRSRPRRSARARRRSSGSRAVEKPWRRWELQLRFGGGERSGDVTVRLDARRAAARQLRARPARPRAGVGRARRARRAQRQRQDDAGRRRSLGRLPLAAGTRWVGPGVRIGMLDQARRGFDGAAAARRVRRAERTAAAGGALAAGQVRPRERRGRARRAQPLAGRAHAREPRAADGVRRELARARRADQPPRPARRSSSSRPRWTPTTARCCWSPTTAGCSRRSRSTARSSSARPRCADRRRGQFAHLGWGHRRLIGCAAALSGSCASRRPERRGWGSCAPMPSSRAP